MDLGSWPREAIRGPDFSLAMSHGPGLPLAQAAESMLIGIVAAVLGGCFSLATSHSPQWHTTLSLSQLLEVEKKDKSVLLPIKNKEGVALPTCLT